MKETNMIIKAFIFAQEKHKDLTTKTAVPTIA